MKIKILRNCAANLNDDILRNGLPMGLTLSGEFRKSGRYSGCIEIDTAFGTYVIPDDAIKTLKDKMNEEAFIEKWNNGSAGYWVENYDRLFWARSYGMELEQLIEMSRDFLLAVHNEM